MKLSVNDRVNRMGTTKPTGIIESIDGKIATVYWGSADKRTFKDDIPLSDLQYCGHVIVSSEEIERRNAEAHALKFHKE